MVQMEQRSLQSALELCQPTKAHRLTFLYIHAMEFLDLAIGASFIESNKSINIFICNKFYKAAVFQLDLSRIDSGNDLFLVESSFFTFEV